MPQKFPVHGFKWIEQESHFSSDFMENYNEDSDEGHFLEVDVLYLEKLHDLQNDLPFLHEKIEIEKVENILAIYITEKIFHALNKF